MECVWVLFGSGVICMYGLIYLILDVECILFLNILLVVLVMVFLGFMDVIVRILLFLEDKV